MIKIRLLMLFFCSCRANNRSKQKQSCETPNPKISPNLQRSWTFAVLGTMADDALLGRNAKTHVSNGKSFPSVLHFDHVPKPLRENIQLFYLLAFKMTACGQIFTTNSPQTNISCTLVKTRLLTFSVFLDNLWSWLRNVLRHIDPNTKCTSSSFAYLFQQFSR